MLANNPGLEDLKITVEDGIATITCKAADKVAAEKAILMIGNVKGVEQVNYDIQQTKENQKLVITSEAAASSDGKSSNTHQNPRTRRLGRNRYNRKLMALANVSRAEVLDAHPARENILFCRPIDVVHQKDRARG